MLEAARSNCINFVTYATKFCYCVSRASNERNEDCLCAAGSLLRPSWTGTAVQRSKTKKRLRLVAPPRSLAKYVI